MKNNFTEILENKSWKITNETNEAFDYQRVALRHLFTTNEEFGRLVYRMALVLDTKK